MSDLPLFKSLLDIRIDELEAEIKTLKADQVIPKVPLNYATAKRAIKYFELEHIGQSQKELWLWAVKKAENDDPPRIDWESVSDVFRANTSAPDDQK